MWTWNSGTRCGTWNCEKGGKHKIVEQGGENEIVEEDGEHKNVEEMNKMKLNHEHFNNT